MVCDKRDVGLLAGRAAGVLGKSGPSASPGAVDSPWPGTPSSVPWAFRDCLPGEAVSGCDSAGPGAGSSLCRACQAARAHGTLSSCEYAGSFPVALQAAAWAAWVAGEAMWSPAARTMADHAA